MATGGEGGMHRPYDRGGDYSPLAATVCGHAARAGGAMMAG